MDIAKISKSYWLQAESYFLQAKLELFMLDLKKVEKSLTQALQIAEKYGLDHLIERISIEQNKYVKLAEKWLKLNSSSKKIAELSNLIPLKEQIKYMLKKRLMLKNLKL